MPPSGAWGGSGKARLIDARTWLGLDPAAQPGFAAALSLVMKRYLAAYGPASVQPTSRAGLASASSVRCEA